MVRRRALVVLLGFGAVLSALGALSALNELVVRSHLRELRADRDHFGALLEASDRFGVREALERYVATPQGRAALVRQCLEEGLRDALEQRLEKQGGTTTSRALMRIAETVVEFEMLARSGAVSALSTSRLGRETARRELRSLLPELEGRSVTLQEYPGTQFTVLDARSARDAFHERGLPRSDALPGYLFLIQHVDDE